MEGFAWALAHRASDHEKLLAHPRKLLVPDDRTGLLSSPGSGKEYGKIFHVLVKYRVITYAQKSESDVRLIIEGQCLGGCLLKTHCDTF